MVDHLHEWQNWLVFVVCVLAGNHCPPEEQHKVSIDSSMLQRHVGTPRQRLIHFRVKEQSSNAAQMAR